MKKFYPIFLILILGAYAIAQGPVTAPRNSIGRRTSETATKPERPLIRVKDSGGSVQESTRTLIFTDPNIGITADKNTVTVTLSEDPVLSNPSCYTISARDSDGISIVDDSGTLGIHIIDGGSVGIKTGRPLTDLHVHDPDDALCSIRITNSTAPTYGFELITTGTLASVWNNENDDIVFGADNLEWMRLDKTGLLGLGTDTPDVQFHIRKNSATAVFRTERNEPAISSSDILARWEVETRDDTDPGICAKIEALSYDTSCGTGWRFSTGTPSALAEVVQIDPYGFVGIGTPWPDSPDKLLHIQHATDAYFRLTRNDTAVVTDDIIGRIEFETRDSDDAGVAAYIQAIAEDNSGNVGLAFGTGNFGSVTEAMRIGKSGYITSATQPCFAATGTDVTNYTVSALVNVPFGTELYDQGNNFSDPYFTAPVTGYYHFDGQITIHDLDTAATNYVAYIWTVTNQISVLFDVSKHAADLPYHTFNISGDVRLTAGQTAHLVISQSGGAQQSDIYGVASRFSGHLIH